MPNPTVPAAATGLPPSIIAFPSGRARPPAHVDAFLDRDQWHQSFVAAHIAGNFRSMSPAESIDTVAKMIEAFGADCIAKILKDNAVALSALRGAVAGLAEADRRIAAAANQVLVREGV